MRDNGRRVLSILGPVDDSLLAIIGVPVLLLMFYFDGMVIGKMLPPAALFVSYVALVDLSSSSLLLVAGACIVASTLGQWTLYRSLNEDSPEFFGVRRRVPYADRIPAFVRGRVGERRLAIVSSGFHRFGGLSLSLTNVIPGVRSVMTIPASLSGYPVERFLAFSIVGNVVYVGLLVVVSLGLVELAGVAPP